MHLATWLHEGSENKFSEDSTIHSFFGSGVYRDLSKGYAFCQYIRVEVPPYLQEYTLDFKLERMSEANAIKNIEFNGSPARIYDYKSTGGITLIGKGITFLVDDGIVSIHVTAPSENFDSYGVLRESLLGIDDIGYFEKPPKTW